jgi:hypothetical protein
MASNNACLTKVDTDFVLLVTVEEELLRAERSRWIQPFEGAAALSIYRERRCFPDGAASFSGGVKPPLNKALRGHRTAKS